MDYPLKSISTTGNMAHNKTVDFFKNASLQKIGEGYSVRYTKYSENKKDTYSGMDYIGDKTEVFDNSADALARLDAITSDAKYVDGDEIEFKTS